MTNLTADQIRMLDAIHLIEAWAVNDLDTATAIQALYDGQHAQLARTLGFLAGVMLRSNRTPAEEIANYRAYLFRERAGE